MDSNPVVALIIALGRALRRLLLPTRSATKLIVGAGGDLTLTRPELITKDNVLWGTERIRGEPHTMEVGRWMTRVARMAQEHASPRQCPGFSHLGYITIARTTQCIVHCISDTLLGRS